MQHQTTINELSGIQGLFSAVDHITVPETNPDTGITEQVVLPPPLIRRTTRRDGTIVWILTPPGIHERIIVADQAPVTVYLKDIDPGRFTGYVQPQPGARPPTPAQAAPQQAPAAWPQPAPAQQPPAPGTYPPQQTAAPQRPAAPWTQPPRT